MLMDSGMRSISNYDSMPYTIVTSLEMSDEPIILPPQPSRLRGLLLTPHTRGYAESSCNCSQYRRQRLKNEFPSVLVHKRPTIPPRGNLFIVLEPITAEGIAGFNVNNEVYKIFPKDSLKILF